MIGIAETPKTINPIAYAIYIDKPKYENPAHTTKYKIGNT